MIYQSIKTYLLIQCYKQNKTHLVLKRLTKLQPKRPKPNIQNNNS